MAEQEGYGGNYGGDGTKPGRHISYLMAKHKHQAGRIPLMGNWIHEVRFRQEELKECRLHTFISIQPDLMTHRPNV